MSDKRKRISFWESESKEIRDWCKAQSNLGTSLELIIADAIKVYGEGDVIKAFLNQRMKDMQSQDSSHYVPSQQAAPTSAAVMTSSSPSRPSNPESHQLPYNNAPTGNMVRQEAMFEPRDQRDSSDTERMGDMIRHDAIEGAREQGEHSDSIGIGDMIRRDALAGTKEQGEPSASIGIGDMIRRDAISTSPPAHNNGGERQDSTSANDSLSIFLGDSGSRLDR
ncbi:hypothetical protein [Paenibacillus glucanolyticus]|uniref:hypothetical protein n=1 Tax=Paenibacillus glucanolyticus TaxID=59843 RepID=UPI00096D37CE|nr:hypothetical protein [Paenibacillus glucanolyticus]OMF76745.1 hypothetical protein BK142_14595 [Paenibacillus glucanolyticus]